MTFIRILLSLIIIGILGCKKEAQPTLSIGLIADPQYQDKDTRGKRNYRASIKKLSIAIDTFNLKEVNFVQNLGDIIDHNWESFDSILKVYESLHPSIENYHLLGNHEYGIDSIYMPSLLTKLKMSNFYYSYVKKNWRFIVLDATDIAYYSNPIHKRSTLEIDEYFEKSDSLLNRKKWNGAIGNDQLRWLKRELELAKRNKEKVILFSHIPLRPAMNVHNLWNDKEVLEVINSYGHIVAYFNGHNHAGAYDQFNGVHFITMYGMVESTNNAFGILEIFEDKLNLKGYGNQENIVMPFD
jgi:3',5'-cyclic AMP phosphodiesterase CpdA